MRDDKISSQALIEHLRKKNFKCGCGAGPDDLLLEADRSTLICKSMFVQASEDGMRDDAERFCGPLAMVHCKRCGKVHLFFVPDVIRAIVIEAVSVPSSFQTCSLRLDSVPEAAER